MKSDGSNRQQGSGRSWLQTIMKVSGMLLVYSYLTDHRAFRELRGWVSRTENNFKPNGGTSLCEETARKVTSSSYWNPFLTPADVIRNNPQDFTKSVLFQDTDFKGNAVHANIMHHFYDSISAILETFPQHKNTLLSGLDINNRTPLHLALEVGAPDKIILSLITPENVLMSDKDGITPLMLAARGASMEVMQEILRTIPQSELSKAINQKDGAGKAVADWNKMSEHEMLKRFSAFAIDATKDEKYCTNSLFYGSQYPYLATPTSSDKAATVFQNFDLEVGSTYWSNAKYNSIKATEDNVAKLRSYATQDTEEAKEARKELSDLWQQSNNPKEPFWKYIDTELSAVEGKLSGTRLVDRYMQNQKQINELIKVPRTNIQLTSEESVKLAKTRGSQSAEF